MVYIRGASARNGPVRDQDRFQRKVKFILIIIGAFAIAAYLVAIPGQEEDVVHVDMSSSITNALTNAVLDIEMAEEIQLEQKEEKLFSTKMLQVEEQMKHDLSNAVQNLQQDPQQLKTIQDEATYALEEKALEKLESKINQVVDEAELEVEEVITEDEEEGMDAKDIETLEQIAEKDIEEEKYIIQM